MCDSSLFVLISGIKQWFSTCGVHSTCGQFDFYGGMGGEKMFVFEFVFAVFV